MPIGTVCFLHLREDDNVDVSFVVFWEVRLKLLPVKQAPFEHGLKWFPCGVGNPGARGVVGHHCVQPQ